MHKILLFMFCYWNNHNCVIKLYTMNTHLPHIGKMQKNTCRKAKNFSCFLTWTQKSPVTLYIEENYPIQSRFINLGKRLVIAKTQNLYLINTCFRLMRNSHHNIFINIKDSQDHMFIMQSFFWFLIKIACTWHTIMYTLQERKLWMDFPHFFWEYIDKFHVAFQKLFREVSFIFLNIPSSRRYVLLYWPK